MKLTQKQLNGLRLYKYSGVDKSLLSKTVLTPYWNNLVKLFPKWFAPNSITLTGLFFVLANILTLLYQDRTYTGNPLPKWVYYSWAIGLFCYQSMDAIDGKQARRTGMAGPLGEMFDHGCDAINTTLEVILCMAAFGYPRSWWTIITQACSLTTFYLSTWEEYHTGTLYLSAFSGPVEGILLICVIYAITGRFSQSFWHFHIIDGIIPAATKLDQLMLGAGGKPKGPLTLVKVFGSLDQWLRGSKFMRELNLVEAFLYFGAVGLAGNVANAYYNVYQARRKANKPVLDPLLGLLPYLFHTSLFAAWLLGPEVNIVNSGKILWFLAYWGACFSYQVSQLILAHVTKSPFPYWNGMMIYSLVGAIDANLPRLFGIPSVIQSTDQRTAYFVAFSAVFAIANYLRFAKQVIWQITEFLGIACFTVRHKDESGKWVENDEAVKEKKGQ